MINKTRKYDTNLKYFLTIYLRVNVADEKIA